jgi:ankyrin repeat protein
MKWITSYTDYLKESTRPIEDVSKDLINLLSERVQPRTQQVRSLIQAGADLEMQDKSKRTPVYLAVINGHTNALRVLLQAGANPNVTAKKKYTNTPLQEAADLGNLEAVKLLIAAGARVDNRDEFGKSALFDAAASWKRDKVRGQWEEIARFLIDAGADVTMVDESLGYTPLHTACQRGNLEIAKMIIAAGADPNVTDVNGVTPLRLAIGSDNVELIRLLLRAGADVNINDVANQSPLYWAIQGEGDNKMEIVQILLDAGADIEARVKSHKKDKGMYQYTPLGAAIFYEEPEIGRLLLSRGASLRDAFYEFQTLTLRDNPGWDPASKTLTIPHVTAMPHKDAIKLIKGFAPNAKITSTGSDPVWELDLSWIPQPDLDKFDLEGELERAIRIEDYETAARLRDKLKGS